MLQYDSVIEITSGGAIVHIANGQSMEFPTDTEAYEYLQDTSRSNRAERRSLSKDTNKVYFVYRICKSDEDNFRNYQYYDGKYFRYGAYDVKRFVKSVAERIAARYSAREDDYNYYVSK